MGRSSRRLSALRVPRRGGILLRQDKGAPACQDRAGAGPGEPREAGSRRRGDRRRARGSRRCARAGEQRKGVTGGVAGTGDQVTEAGDTGWKPVVRAVAREQHAGATRAAAQHIHVTSNSPAERPNTAILAGKAGLAIRKACYSVLQEVTEFDEKLHANHG